MIGKNVQMGVGNRIGPHVIMEDGVKIGSHNKIHASAYLCRGTELGNHNEIHMGAIIGHAPQDLAYRNEPSYTRIGNDNQIREYVTIHRGTKADSATVIGNENYLMAYSHVAHNCEIGNNVIMVNQASLTGYCKVEDQAILSGMTGFHQFTRIGRLVLVSALSACNKDIPPFMICGGRPAVVLGLNVVGLRRAGVKAASRDEIKKAYKYLYRSGLTVSHALEKIKAELHSEEIKHLVRFVESSERGILASGDETADLLLPRKRASTFA